MTFNTLSFTHRARRSVRSADGAAWRIKPELRVLARIIAERQAAERTNPFGRSK